MTGQEEVIGPDDNGSHHWPDEFKSNPRILRATHEVDHIVGQFQENRGINIEVAAHSGGIAYLYHRSEILVPFEYLTHVMAFLSSEESPPSVMSALTRASSAEQVPWQPAAPGVVAVNLNDFNLTVPEALDRIDAAFGEGIATPNHVITVGSNGASPGGTAGICPATEPQTVDNGTEPFPSAGQTGGAGVRVYIADTGLLENADAQHPWLRGVRRATKPDGTEQGWDTLGPENSDHVAAIPPYAGHGTFVAGLVRCMAPQADVIVSNVFTVAGSVLESDLVPDLSNALKHGVDIFNLSIAAATRKGHPLVALEKWLNRLSKHKGVACIVAAGNSSSAMPYWPGASPEVISVGALAGDWRSRAEFSNYGGWVDVYAPGRDLVNAYATGTYKCHAAPYRGEDRQFYGMARWSGTSFSTPIVTGLIAARMSRTGENARQAATALLAEAQSQAIPGVGPILLPSSGSSAPTF